MNSQSPNPSARTLVAAAFVILLIAPSARAQDVFARPGDLPAIDHKLQAEIVDSVTTVIDTLYVIEDTADRIIAQLRGRLAAGAYREITDPAEFVLKLDEDARAVYDDHHFGIRAMYPLDPNAEEQAEDPRETEAYKRSLRARNYGFRKVEILPGNVGYLELDQFAHTEDAANVANAAMGFFANTDALIIDLRENGGGAASMIRLLTSYLFEERQHLINWYVRDTEETVQSWTLDYVPGQRLSDIPVFVLTSDFTGSAAEEFTFDLKHLERATVVGDTTGGGGHTVATVFADFADFRVGMRIPYGRAFDPKTGQGWEGRGVIPHVAVPAEDALATAHITALDSLSARAESEDARRQLTWARRELECRLSPVTLDRDQLGEFVGTYGPRRVFFDGDVLCYQREDRPKLLLEPMGDDVFRVGDLDHFRLQFERDASGHVHRVVGVYDNGREDSNDRTG